MSDVIDFLQRMGADASLRDAPTDRLAQELERTDVDDELAAAILRGDMSVLRQRMAPDIHFSVQLKTDEDDEDGDSDDRDDGSVGDERK